MGQFQASAPYFAERLALFIGKVPIQLVRRVAKYVVGDAYVVCSGEFTIERTLRLEGFEGRIFGNDVSLYSCMLGRYFSGQGVDYKIVDPEHQWMFDYVEGSDEEKDEIKAATILLLQDYLTRFAREQRGIRGGWENSLKKVRAKVRLAKEELRLDGFTETDLAVLVDKIPKSSTILASPPTYLSGYEKMYKGLDEAVWWESPDYEIWEPEESMDELVDKLENRPCVLYSDRDDLPLDLVGQITQPRHRVFYTYTTLNLPTHSLHKKAVECKPCGFEFLTLDNPVEDVSISRLENVTLFHYRDVWLEKVRDACRSIDVGYGLFSGGRIFGVVGFTGAGSRTLRIKSSEPTSLNLAFSVVIPNKRRLAKLALMITKTTEMQTLLEDFCLRRVTLLNTTVFTNKPVSMQYRGVYKLIERDSKKPVLKYQSEAGLFSVEEAVSTWKQKFEK